MPVGDLLISVTDLEQGLFIQMFADQLHSHGHIVGESAGDGQRWDAGRVCGRDVNIR